MEGVQSGENDEKKEGEGRERKQCGKMTQC